MRLLRNGLIWILAIVMLAGSAMPASAAGKTGLVKDEFGDWVYYLDGVEQEYTNEFVDITNNGKTYTAYFNGVSEVVMGQRKIGKYTYYFRPGTGEMVKDEFLYLSDYTGPSYVDKKGHFVESGTKVINGKKYWFDENGQVYFCGSKGTKKSKINKVPMYLGDPQGDLLIDKMVKKAGIKKSMSTTKKIKKTYEYLTKNFRYYYEVTKNKKYHKLVSKKAAKKYKKKTDKWLMKGKISYSSAYNTSVAANWVYHQGVCDTFSDLFALMLRRVKVQAGKVSGTVAGAGHQFNWAKIEGKKYYFDPGSSIHYYTRYKKINYGYYKMRKKDMKQYTFYKEW